MGCLRSGPRGQLAEGDGEVWVVLRPETFVSLTRLGLLLTLCSSSVPPWEGLRVFLRVDPEGQHRIRVPVRVVHGDEETP